MKKILVPTDFSKPANNALSLAHELAEVSGAELRVVHVIEQPGIDSFNAMGEMIREDQMDNVYMVQLIKKTKEQLNNIVEDSKYDNINIHYELLIGSPHKNIARNIAEYEADLVVMGTEGVGASDTYSMGSNAERVVRFAECPVISLKHETKLEELKNIAFATDLQDNQTLVINKFKDLQDIIKARCHLVRINTPYSFAGTKEVKKQMMDLVSENKIENVTTNTYSSQRTEEGILDFSNDIDADMIAISTHGRTGLMHTLLGSLAEDVVNHAKRPVWTYKIK